MLSSYIRSGGKQRSPRDEDQGRQIFFFRGSKDTPATLSSTVGERLLAGRPVASCWGPSTIGTDYDDSGDGTASGLVASQRVPARAAAPPAMRDGEGRLSQRRGDSGRTSRLTGPVPTVPSCVVARPWLPAPGGAGRSAPARAGCAVTARAGGGPTEKPKKAKDMAQTFTAGESPSRREKHAATSWFAGSTRQKRRSYRLCEISPGRLRDLRCQHRSLYPLFHGRRSHAFHLIGMSIRPREVGREQGGSGAEEDGEARHDATVARRL